MLDPNHGQVFGNTKEYPKPWKHMEAHGPTKSGYIWLTLDEFSLGQPCVVLLRQLCSYSGVDTNDAIVLRQQR